jgi:hypothetical protein
MNTQLAFAFGMLAMIAITLVVVVVGGIVKVIRQAKQIDGLNHELSDFIGRVERSPALDDLAREINHRVDNEVKEIHLRIDKWDEEFDRGVGELRSYTDSRFDKFENKITSKQILKD